MMDVAIASPIVPPAGSVHALPAARRGSQRAPGSRKERIPHFLAAPSSANGSPVVAAIGPPSSRHLPQSSPSASPLRSGRASQSSPDSPPRYSAAQLAASNTPNNPPSIQLNIGRSNAARYVKQNTHGYGHAAHGHAGQHGHGHGHVRAQSMQILSHHNHHLADNNHQVYHPFIIIYQSLL